ncbi:MAG: hypothetical protein FWB98_00600 [Defluviitaleaceae bacterium]|nr:hypothetical protein [Defluviitaleaceae bacterium]
MEEKAFGKEIATVGTVILYRINVAMAAILVFINVQIFVGLFMDEYADFPIVTLIILSICIIYGFVAVNFMITRIKIFENGLEYRSLFKRRFVSNQDIKHTEFYRKDKLRMRITIHMKQGNPMVINIAKYKDNQPIVDFCADFKKKDKLT